MAEIHEMAESLGRALGGTPEYRTLARAIESADNDREIVALTNEVKGLRETLAAAASRGEELPEAEMEKLETAMGRLQASSVYQSVVRWPRRPTSTGSCTALTLPSAKESKRARPLPSSSRRERYRDGDFPQPTAPAPPDVGFEPARPGPPFFRPRYALADPAPGPPERDNGHGVCRDGGRRGDVLAGPRAHRGRADPAREACAMSSTAAWPGNRGSRPSSGASSTRRSTASPRSPCTSAS